MSVAKILLLRRPLMRGRLPGAMVGALLALTSTMAPATPLSPTITPSPKPDPQSVAISDTGRHELTKADADAWLDGFMPYALQQNDIAGAEVVIVKNGQVLTERGFGYADLARRRPVDPATTLFRPGSISKLFTWTAVMQLVEQGKIDLDADVNRYIDFKIPPFHGQPVTMRDLMTHTPGFEEAFKGGFKSSGAVPPLSVMIKRLRPNRVFAPGSTPAYSNYGAALAGYIVERVSGMPFDIYVERKILQPLGMSHSTFVQPLPSALAPLMSKGYWEASKGPKPFELIAVSPAGGLSLTGDDMAKFMIAQLNHGAGLMRPQTSQQMLTPTRVAVPGLNRMALGFYEQQVNGLSAVGHGGDSFAFHSYLFLLPTQDVGLYISTNSAGASDAVNFDLRLALFQAFGDRYFPAPAQALVELPSSKADARMLAGDYTVSRGYFTNFLDFGNFLQQTHVGLDADGRPAVPNEVSARPHEWIEVAPFLWQDAYGPQRLGAKVVNGKVTRWSLDAVAPFMVWDRVAWFRNAAWLMPAFLAGLVIIAITALSWPAGAVARLRYGAALRLTGLDRLLYRLTSGLAWLVLAVLGGWLLLLQTIEHSEANLDPWIWLQEIASAIGFVGLGICALVMAWRSWARSSTRTGRAWSTLRAAGVLAVLWVATAFHLITFGANY